ncbi:hypothetical protein GJ744_009656 [Endocarpon pusillum]|uniref:Uncharacterized protein n=1 Tax=Endocarpon pusillum TaxID=364733 RepID=A0A8H7E2G1_9EURO|nr:hypothetical protein GJ744_009656 [Endocarpon pusillum]
MTLLGLTRNSVKPVVSRPGYTNIHQEGPQFGATHVSGGNSFQGNFVSLTINSTARLDYCGQLLYSSLEPIKAFVS